MKKYILGLIITGLLTVVIGSQVLALEATVDTGNAEKGTVTVNLSGIGEKQILAQVDKDGQVCRYVLKSSTSNLPLQMGVGNYTISILENVEGQSFMKVSSVDFSVASIDENAMFTASIPNVDYAASVTAIPTLQGYAEGKETNDKINVIYTDIIENITYDHDKAIALANASFYMPVIDDAYAAKKGICYDYSAILGGALRSLGIPTKLVTGYVPEIPGVFHAWNEILIDGEWVAVDTTYDATAFQAGVEFNMVKDKEKTQIVRVY